MAYAHFVRLYVKETIMTIRITKRKLYNRSQVLTERDKEILRSLRRCSFLKTGHVGRLHFKDSSTPEVAVRGAHRTLAKLQEWGLVQLIERNIGGVRAGSTACVWTLALPGEELLCIHEREGKLSAESRKRVLEPGYPFLKHTLAVSELYTQLHTSNQLLKAEFEPECWRAYSTIFGNSTLKPDMYAVTKSGDGSPAGSYEDHWFFEVDLDTSAPKMIIRKCESYSRYFLTESEYKRIGVFPKVVWIVPNEKRRDTISEHIRERVSEFVELFAVITFDELDSLICGKGVV